VSARVLIWSPQSNLVLYQTTTDIPLAKRHGVNISIGVDWNPTGDTLFDELRVANGVNTTTFIGAIDVSEWLSMITTNPAKALALETKIGKLVPGDGRRSRHRVRVVHRDSQGYEGAGIDAAGEHHDRFDESSRGDRDVYSFGGGPRRVRDRYSRSVPVPVDRRAAYERPMKPLVTAATRRPARALATSPAAAGSISASGLR
jgi:hypothetical protein